MKKYILSIGVLALIISCSGSKKAEDKFFPEMVQSGVVDSFEMYLGEELKDDDWVVEEVVPETADESFADFFYNFVCDTDFQHERIVFPLAYYKGNEKIRVHSDEWLHDPLFSQEQAYTILFDKAEDMEVEKDTTLNSVQVDLIDLKRWMVKRYYFERKQSSWFLEAINDEKLKVDSTGQKENFFMFYKHFSCDSIFQIERLGTPLTFVTVDPEDEFQILETTLEKGQWFSFRPPMRNAWLTNIHYGQEESQSSNSKVLEFKGLGNGFSNVLYFKRMGGVWKLVKFEDLGD